MKNPSNITFVFSDREALNSRAPWFLLNLVASPAISVCLFNLYVHVCVGNKLNANLRF